MTDRIMSLDVESNGLWGKLISIGFTIEEKGHVLLEKEACFISETESYSEWVIENVIKPLKENTSVERLESYEELLQWFANEYNNYKNNYRVVYHIGQIVEINLLKELINYKIID